jgi:RNA polymerase sigma-70 factor, ECF subfamily
VSPLVPYHPDATTVKEAIQRFHGGDIGAFETIYYAHRRIVYRLCLRLLRDPAEAEDLTQDVFARVMAKIHTFRGESAFTTWMHRLAVNLVFMHCRPKKVMQISLDDIAAPHDERRLVAELGRPDLQMSGLPDRLRLDSAVRRLPDSWRTVFKLYDV